MSFEQKQKKVFLPNRPTFYTFSGSHVIPSGQRVEMRRFMFGGITRASFHWMINGENPKTVSTKCVSRVVLKFQHWYISKKNVGIRKRRM